MSKDKPPELDLDLLLTDKEINSAFDGDFGEIYFDHKPTADEIMLIKLRLVAKAQLAKDQQHEQARVERIFKEIENHSHKQATNMLGISLSRDDWQALKKQEGL